MDYNKETDRYLANSKVLYNSTQKDNFHEICLLYNLVAVSDNQYKCATHGITITSKENELIIVARPDNAKDFLENSDYKKFYDFIKYYVYMDFQIMEMSVLLDKIVIFSLKGLIQFLDLLEYDKVTQNVPVHVLKKELNDYKKRLTKYWFICANKKI